MRIGVNGIFLEGKRTGIGRYLESLLREWSACEEELVIYYLSEEPRDSFLSPFSKRRLTLMEPGQYDIFDWELRNNPVSVFFSALYDLPFSLRSPAVITIHDMIHEACPESFSRAQLDYLQEKTRYGVYRADRIITDSRFSKEEIISRFPNAGEKIVTIPLAPSPFFRPRQVERDFPMRRFGVSAPFILYVGAITPKRHIRPLIEAFGHLAPLFPDWSVITIGRNVTYPPEDLHLLVEQYNDRIGRRAIVYEEFVPDDELLDLYNSAELFVYLSSYEGFGMPPLEAMSCGAPVMTTTASSLPEVVGDAALKVNPFDSGEILEGLKLLMGDGAARQRLRDKGFSQAAKFSWRETAHASLEVIKSVVR